MYMRLIAISFSVFLKNILLEKQPISFPPGDSRQQVSWPFPHPHSKHPQTKGCQNSESIPILNKYPLFTDKWTLFCPCALSSVWHEAEQQKGIKMTTRTIPLFSHSTDPFVQSKCQLWQQLWSELPWEPPFSPPDPSGSKARLQQRQLHLVFPGESPAGPKVLAVKRSPCLWLEDKGRLQTYPVDLRPGTFCALLSGRNIFCLCPHINSNQ